MEANHVSYSKSKYKYFTVVKAWFGQAINGAGWIKPAFEVEYIVRTYFFFTDRYLQFYVQETGDRLATVNYFSFFLLVFLISIEIKFNMYVYCIVSSDDCLRWIMHIKHS